MSLNASVYTQMNVLYALFWTQLTHSPDCLFTLYLPHYSGSGFELTIAEQKGRHFNLVRVVLYPEYTMLKKGIQYSKARHTHLICQIINLFTGMGTT